MQKGLHKFFNTDKLRCFIFWIGIGITTLLISTTSCENKKASFEIVNEDLLFQIFECVKMSKKAPSAYRDEQHVKLILNERLDNTAIVIITGKAQQCEYYIGTISKKGYYIHLYTNTRNNIEELVTINYEAVCELDNNTGLYNSDYQEKFTCCFTYKDGILDKMKRKPFIREKKIDEAVNTKAYIENAAALQQMKVIAKINIPHQRVVKAFAKKQ